MPYTVIACRSALAVIFGVAALRKASGWRAFIEFEDTLRTMRLVPARLRRVTAAAVIGLESALLIALLAKPAVPVAFVGVLGLMALCAGTTAVVVRRRTPVRCRCFGAGGGQLGYPHVVRDGLIAAIAAVGLLGVWIDAGPADHPGGIAIGVLCGVIAAALLMRFDELADLFTTRTV